MRKIINAIVFYAAWFAIVETAAANLDWLAAIAGAVALVINIALAPRRAREILLVLAAAVLGLAVEGLLMSFGFAVYAAPGPVNGAPPAWLILMWMAFATTLNASLAWLKDRLRLAAALGLVCGPLSYYAGARLGAMEFSQPLWLALSAVGALWAVALPLLLYLARRLNSGEPDSVSCPTPRRA